MTIQETLSSLLPYHLRPRAGASEKAIWRLFTCWRRAPLSFWVLFLLILSALTAPIVAWFLDLRPQEQNLFHRFEKPGATIELSVAEKKKILEDYFSTKPRVAENLRKHLQTQPSSPAALEKSTRPPTPPPNDVLSETLAAMTPSSLRNLLSEVRAPQDFRRLVGRFERSHWLGTDELGRDVLIRSLYGARVSLGVALVVAFISAFMGLVMGCLSGYYGGWCDALLMRVTDALLALPLLPVLIVVAAIDVTKLNYLSALLAPEHHALLKLIVILCLFSWMGVARLVRSHVLSLKEREFIIGAKTMGANDAAIIFYHLIPNVSPTLLVAVTLGVGEAILFESVLSYLGMGVPPPTPSWGNMLFNAQDVLTQSPSLALIPGLMILITTLSVNSLGDHFQRGSKTSNNGL